MARQLVWIDEPQASGWSCTNCRWRFPVPTLLSDPEAKRAYDRLASLKFSEHTCDTTPVSHHEGVANPSSEPSFADRVRKLIKVGYKPKDAVAIALDDIALEHRNDSRAMAKAKAEAEDFLRRVREGRI